MGYTRRRHDDRPWWLAIILAIIMIPIAVLFAWVAASLYAWTFTNYGFLGLVLFLAVSSWLVGTTRGVKAIYE